MVCRACGHTSPYGGCHWVGRFGASRGIPTKLARTLPRVPGIPTKLARTLQRVRKLQLTNIRLIPNTALFAHFSCCAV
jgi:hypothetical protein